MSTQNFPELLQHLIADTLKAGADAADARISISQGLSVDVRNGELESVERDEAAGVALRALVGKRQAHVSGSDTSPDGLKALVERVVAMAKIAPEDPYCGIPDASELAGDPVELDLDGDPSPTAEELEARALEAEAASLKHEGIMPTGNAGASWGMSATHVAASNGFAASRSGGMSTLSVLAICQKDGEMERDYDSCSKRKAADLTPGAMIGDEAAKRALRRLGARKVESQTAAVIFDNRLARSLIGPLISAISGPSIARGVSFLKDQLGKQVFSKGVNIIDDPLRRGGYASRWFDGEGRPVQKNSLIDDGVLTQWLLSGPAAAQLGLAPNGFSSSGFGDPPGVTTSNLDLQPGTKDLAGLMKDAGKGLLVTDMFGPSLNPNTGDYSVGVSGLWFENGEIAFPVNEVTVAGDLPGIYARLVPGSDLEIRGSTNSPSLLIDGMTIAGT
ncbi:MAG: modulator protein [Hirschia sp.]|nr:modulator protein [Hirschia sp.]MBF18467.1 modulator protein [Hirschia sp.]